MEPLGQRGVRIGGHEREQEAVVIADEVATVGLERGLEPEVALVEVAAGDGVAHPQVHVVQVHDAIFSGGDSIERAAPGVGDPDRSEPELDASRDVDVAQLGLHGTGESVELQHGANSSGTADADPHIVLGVEVQGEHLGRSVERYPLGDLTRRRIDRPYLGGGGAPHQAGVLEERHAAADVDVGRGPGRGIDPVQRRRVARHPQAPARVHEVRVGVAGVDVDGVGAVHPAVADLQQPACGIDCPHIGAVSSEVAAELARFHARAERSVCGVDGHQRTGPAIARDPDHAVHCEGGRGARHVVRSRHGVRRRIDPRDRAGIERDRPDRVARHRHAEQLRAADVNDALDGRCGDRRRRGARGRRGREPRGRRGRSGRRSGLRRAAAPCHRDADGHDDGHERSPHAHPETLAQRAAQSGNSGTMNPGSWPS